MGCQESGFILGPWLHREGLAGRASAVCLNGTCRLWMERTTQNCPATHLLQDVSRGRCSKGQGSHSAPNHGVVTQGELRAATVSTQMAFQYHNREGCVHAHPRVFTVLAFPCQIPIPQASPITAPPGKDSHVVPGS